jgi:ABC-2 type transport system ATP-binding protein
MYKDIVEFAELERFMDQKLKNYSSGMQVRLAFSLAIRAQSDILLVDEVLAVGDADFQRKCFDYFKQLKKDKKTVVFVSHDMNAVREFCDKGILVDRGVIKTIGDSKDIAREYALQFMDGYDSEGPAVGAPKRLGNKKAEIINAKARIEDGYIIADVSARVNERLDELVYGFHVIGADGVEVTAMNNRMMNLDDIKDPEPGSQIDFQWKMLNVFSDGKYSVLLTLVDGSYAQLDYFENAVQFRVKREERSNTAIFPPVDVKYKLQKPPKA